MLLGVVSDTHGNVPAIQAVADRFRRAAVDQVLHLGDDYLDILFFEAAHLKVVAVPGLYCQEYRDPTIPNRRLENLAGVTFLMTHTPELSKFDLPGDLNPASWPEEVDVVLYGHTHIPGIVERQGVWWVNPGHLKAHDRRGHPLSYAFIRLDPPAVDVRIVGLNTGQTLIHNHFKVRR